MEQERLVAHKERQQRDATIKRNEETYKQERLAREEKEQAKRQKLADTYFESIRFDTSKFVTLSKSLRNSGATVEIVGRNYTEYRNLYEKKDWLGLINAMNKTNPSKVYRSERDILDSFYDLSSKSNLQLLVKTSQTFQQFEDGGSRLFIISFPLSADHLICYSDSGASEQSMTVDGFRPGGIHFSVHLERHPNGSGYFTTSGWELKGVQVVGTDRGLMKNEYQRSGQAYYQKMLENLSKTNEELKKRFLLGQVSEGEFRELYRREIVRLYQETVKWSETR